MQSRREFLQRLAASAAVMALDPLQGISAATSVYRNARLGLTVRLPEGWEFSSIADFAALRERQVLQDAIDSLGGSPHPLKDPSNLPVFLFEDPRHRDGEFAPAIILYDEPLWARPPANEATAHTRMLRGLGRSYRDLRVIDPPRPLALGAVPATRSRFSYLHEIDSGKAVPLEVRTLLVFRAPRVHTYYLVDSAPSPCISPEVWEEFIASIQYA